MIDEFSEAGIGIGKNRHGEICFKREDICKRNDKLISLLKNSDTHMIRQIAETEVPNQRRSFEEWMQNIQPLLTPHN